MARPSIADGREVDLPGGPDAVLLLHGLTGSTFEVLPVAERLAAAGMRCLAPIMAGHGSTPGDLVGVPWTDWVEKAQRDLARLEGARRTFVVGCSMGALVACVLAHDAPARVDGLVLLAPALELQLQGKLGALLGRLGPLGRCVIPKTAGSDVLDEEMRRRNPTMPGVPLASVAELSKLAAHVDRQLPGIAAPALVIAATHDHTVTLAGARRLARRIGSGPAELVILQRSWHLVGIDVEREQCAAEALRFLDAIPVPGGRRGRTARSAGGGPAADEQRATSTRKRATPKRERVEAAGRKRSRPKGATKRAKAKRR